MLTSAFAENLLFCVILGFDERFYYGDRTGKTFYDFKWLKKRIHVEDRAKALAKMIY